ncbi:DUF3038 domain-containing protein [Synechococcus sp. Tobar12-5m-g]|uniref:DUF3038 domain-containing protein n=1 Tax=unclassified Synechococcus TaxID=2626047 RepID=UPI0020CB7D76|nr:MULTISPECIES: DUF3038 domain-containing protein [unclassified Synechococcus]MCP9771392.1 DUF3038 domain-containing protein [Synechococcus sp. Tobar12-5m-g]MCP9872331.1 DUF3038 domain-containing protein [Synechococcus sp. Cruz CV-v-12]
MADAPLTNPERASGISRRGLERLDLMLLSVEALDLNGGEAMLWMAGQLGFTDLFPNRVELWKRRCFNPLRLACRRGQLSEPETDALINLLCALADRLYPMLRQLLSSAEPAAVTAERWGLFQKRLEELVRERLNPRRGGVQKLLDPTAGPPLRLQLIQGLAFGAGTGGFDRLKASLMDATA